MHMKLPAETAKLYALNRKLKGGPRFDFGKFGTVDFSKLMPKQAASLVKAGFPHLKEKKQKGEG